MDDETFPHELDALSELIERLEQAWLPGAYPESERFHGYEPLAIPVFLRGMRELGPADGRRLLEVGCGIGTKLVLARALGWHDLTGIESHRPYLEAARRLCPWPEVELVEADALDFDRYGDFDVVFMYRPLVRTEEQRQLEQAVAAAMRPGALAFFPYGVAGLPALSLAPGVWRLRG